MPAYTGTAFDSDKPVRGLELLSKRVRMSSPTVKTPVMSCELGSVLLYQGSCTATKSHLQGSAQDTRQLHCRAYSVAVRDMRRPAPQLHSRARALQ